MNKKQLTEKIIEWEDFNQESFLDYFMDDEVDHITWFSTLLGKIDQSSYDLIEKSLINKQYIDQSLLFEIYNEHDKNVEFWAEFLLSTNYYKSKVLNFLNENSF